ncbi:MAG: uroporphyrinogen decarboxylase family protein [Limnochordia bacterium]|jgi:uroporphyrinogen decarboxylase
MNSYQRTLAAIERQATDRVPVIPLIIQYALHISSIPHREYSSNGQKMAEAQITSLRRHNYDGIHITTDNQIISEAMGCEVYLPYDEPPQYRKRVLGDSKDLTKLAKVDPYSSGRMPVILSATRLAREELGDEYFIKTNCDSGPFSIASALRGEELFYMDIYEDPQFVMDLVEICTDVLIAYGKAIAASGAHALTFGDSPSGLISREHYEKFALPFAKRAISELKSTGLPIFYHICGNTSHIIDLMCETGADVLEIDHLVDLEFAVDKVGSRVCLEGNVDPTGVLLQGTPDEVYAASMKCIEVARNGGSLILSSGCEVPRHTPPENIDQMLQAAIDSVR